MFGLLSYTFLNVIAVPAAPGCIGFCAETLTRLPCGKFMHNARRQSQQGTRQLLSTAYHEAGHAVLAWHLGLKFLEVTIDPREGSLGHIS